MSSPNTEPVGEANDADAAEQNVPVSKEPEATERPDVPLEVSEADAAEQAAEVPDNEEYEY